MKYIKQGITYKYKYPDFKTEGSCDARYCYSVWMRHLKFYYELRRDIPQTVIEFGPGDTIGIGLMALLCGAREYYGLDFKYYEGNRKIFQIFHTLLNMLQQKKDIPGDDEFPFCEPKLKSYKFPEEILTDEVLGRSLDAERIEEIRRNIQQFKDGKDSDMIHFMAPWWKSDIKQVKGDFIFSQAVFEHIDAYNYAHEIIGNMVNQGGVVSHQIDFSCHACADKWNGHWSYNRIIWKMVYGSRPYFLNRAPLHNHIRALQRSGVKIKKVIRRRGNDGISLHELCRECSNINERDFVTRSAYIIGVKQTKTER